MKQINDRFSFDDLFGKLLKEGLDKEETLDYFFCNYSLSALVFQERIENKYYQKIKAGGSISPDLLELKNEIFNKQFTNKN